MIIFIISQEMGLTGIISAVTALSGALGGGHSDYK